MKKLLYIFIICCVLFIGIDLGSSSRGAISKEIEDKTDKFEEDITNPNNDYKPGQDNKKVEPNITNNLARRGEKAISGIFDYTFGLLEKVITGK